MDNGWNGNDPWLITLLCCLFFGGTGFHMPEETKEPKNIIEEDPNDHNQQN